MQHIRSFCAFTTIPLSSHHNIIIIATMNNTIPTLILPLFCCCCCASSSPFSRGLSVHDSTSKKYHKLTRNCFLLIFSSFDNVDETSFSFSLHENKKKIPFL
ncbi:unnamed protein product, partial [Linum tenue]